MLRWMTAVISDEGGYTRVALALGAVILAGVAGVVVATLRV